MYGRASHNNPGVSTRNWRAAVDVATQNVQALKVMVQADPEDPLPDSRFEFATTLARPAPGHALQPEKMLKFEFVGTDNEALTYEEVEIALLGLMKYTTVWDSGSKNDQVRMCTFRLFYEDNDSPFAEGSVRLTADSLAQAMNTS